MRCLFLIAFLTATAHADPPTAATRGMLLAIGDGSVPLASLIDPARGVWLVDAKPQLVCGADLLDLMIEVQMHAAWWGRTASCENRGTRATCTFSNGMHDMQLQFERGAGPLVLRAFRRDVTSVAELPHGAPCPPGAKVPVLPPAVAATVRRESAPADGNTPTVMTQAMLRHLADGDWHLADFVDREHGLVILDNPPDATSDGSVPKRNARVCGGTLPAELAAIQARIAWPIHEVDKANATIGCTNAKSGATCVVSEMGEWGPVMHLYFRQTPHGLVLDAFTVDDEHQVPEHQLEPHYINAEIALAHAALSPCP